MAYDFDLFIIGGGSGGVRAARIASENGAKVAMAEEYRLGGTCVIRGCIPKKLLVYASHFSEDFEDAKSYGWTVPPATFNWQKLIAAKDQEIARLEGFYLQTLKNNNVRLYEGRAVLKDKNTVLVAGESVTAETILIATGAAPYIPGIPGEEHAISSNEAFHLKDLPERVAVVGAGYIAVEFAGIFKGLGSDVTVIYRRDKVLRGFAEHLRDRLTAAMTAGGINFLFGTVIEKIEKTAGGLKVTYSDGETGEFDVVLCALGRLPNTAGLGLEEIGVKLAKNGAVKVDEYSKTSVDNIYAVGDVTDRINLTPVAIREGHAFALTKYARIPTSPEHDKVASAVFSHPPLATVGLTERQARERGLDVDVYTSEFRPLKLTLTPRQDKTFIKMIVDRDTDVVLGAHMLGADAAEIIQGIAIAVKAGLTKADFDRTVAIHPTTAEEFVLLKQKR
jgi:glutathione reductase (NADPH)